MLLFSFGVRTFLVALSGIYSHQVLVCCWSLWCLMSLQCGEFQTLLEFGPLAWNLGDGLIVFRFRLEGAVVYLFA